MKTLFLILPIFIIGCNSQELDNSKIIQNESAAKPNNLASTLSPGPIILSPNNPRFPQDWRNRVDESHQVIKLNDKACFVSFNSQPHQKNILIQVESCI